MMGTAPPATSTSPMALARPATCSSCTITTMAFQKFFDRLAADGINKSNTLFVFTVDEGDHFVGDAPTPAGCDGVNTPCNYNRVGEINADLRRMVYTQFGDSTAVLGAFGRRADRVRQRHSTQPLRDQTDPLVRSLEREMGRLSWLNPYTGAVENNIMVALADHTEMKTLHMVTADPFRTPTFTPFADPDWFFFATGGATHDLRHPRRLRVHPGADHAELRLEPRRHSGRDRHDLGWLRRAGCRPDRSRPQDLVRSHRCASDDTGA